jgi:hypothetical protein
LFEPPSKRATTAPLAGRRKLRSTLAVAGGLSDRLRGDAFSCFGLAALALRADSARALGLAAASAGAAGVARFGGGADVDAHPTSSTPATAQAMAAAPRPMNVLY